MEKSRNLETTGVRVDYLDQFGIKRRVLIPEGVSDYEEGIPISVPVDSLYTHCSIEFRRALVEELYARGLVEACDFRKAGAAELVAAALRSVIKHDVLNIISLASEECSK